MTTINWANVESWYSGKALEKLRTITIPALQASEKIGYWLPGVSRGARAALGKQTVTEKWIRGPRVNGRHTKEGEIALDRITGGWHVSHALMFGQVGNAPQVQAVLAKVERQLDAVDAATLQRARRWADDFAPVAALLALLDMSRPRPTVVFGSLSPTVANNLGKAMGVALDSIESPPIEWSWITRKRDDGTEYRIQVGKILWPAGTRHAQSRFAHGSRAGNMQCHACGHAIRDPYNWVPLLGHASLPAIDRGDFPVSLWVGRDCASRLFNVKVTGDAEYDGRFGEGEDA